MQNNCWKKKPNSRKKENVRTEAEFLLKADANKKKAEHVGKDMNDAGMKPYAWNEAPTLVTVHHFIDIESPHLVQSDQILRKEKWNWSDVV